MKKHPRLAALLMGLSLLLLPRLGAAAGFQGTFVCDKVGAPLQVPAPFVLTESADGALSGSLFIYGADVPVLGKATGNAAEGAMLFMGREMPLTFDRTGTGLMMKPPAREGAPPPSPFSCKTNPLPFATLRERAAAKTCLLTVQLFCNAQGYFFEENGRFATSVQEMLGEGEKLPQGRDPNTSCAAFTGDLDDAEAPPTLHLKAGVPGKPADTCTITCSVTGMATGTAAYDGDCGQAPPPAPPGEAPPALSP